MSDEARADEKKRKAQEARAARRELVSWQKVEVREVKGGKPGALVVEVKQPLSRREAKRLAKLKGALPKPTKPKKGGAPAKVYSKEEIAAYVAEHPLP